MATTLLLTNDSSRGGYGVQQWLTGERTVEKVGMTTQEYLRMHKYRAAQCFSRLSLVILDLRSDSSRKGTSTALVVSGTWIKIWDIWQKQLARGSNHSSLRILFPAQVGAERPLGPITFW